MLVCWGFGASNELFEFLSALRFPDADVGGLENTGWDLAFNALGGVLAAIACTARFPTSPYSNPPVERLPPLCASGKTVISQIEGGMSNLMR
jgi:hypothetical protein